MSALIDPLSCDFWAELMKQIFIPTDAQAILSILLSARLLEDKLVWVYTPKGKFTVSSAYKLTFFLFCRGVYGRIFKWGEPQIFLAKNLEVTFAK